jgi:hypothetical protein
VPSTTAAQPKQGEGESYYRREMDQLAETDTKEEAAATDVLETTDEVLADIDRLLAESQMTAAEYRQKGGE